MSHSLVNPSNKEGKVCNNVFENATWNLESSWFIVSRVNCLSPGEWQWPGFQRGGKNLGIFFLDKWTFNQFSFFQPFSSIPSHFPLGRPCCMCSIGIRCFLIGTHSSTGIAVPDCSTLLSQLTCSVFLPPKNDCCFSSLSSLFSFSSWIYAFFFSIEFIKLVNFKWELK